MEKKVDSKEAGVSVLRIALALVLHSLSVVTPSKSNENLKLALHSKTKTKWRPSWWMVVITVRVHSNYRLPSVSSNFPFANFIYEEVDATVHDVDGDDDDGVALVPSRRLNSDTTCIKIKKKKKSKKKKNNRNESWGYINFQRDENFVKTSKTTWIVEDFSRGKQQSYFILRKNDL